MLIEVIVEGELCVLSFGSSSSHDEEILATTGIPSFFGLRSKLFSQIYFRSKRCIEIPPSSHIHYQKT